MVLYGVGMQSTGLQELGCISSADWPACYNSDTSLYGFAPNDLIM